mmetsp:Transcript_44693/g.140066  ORF Transcript_44693/g.140066 Transcript_44693/m.140066 type:complete len:535 (+) Transcript_44693:398-2002(+)
MGQLLLCDDGVSDARALRVADLADRREEALLGGLEEGELLQHAAGDSQRELVLQRVGEHGHDPRVQRSDRVRLVDVFYVAQDPKLELLLHGPLLHEKQGFPLRLSHLILQGPQRGDHLRDACQELPNVANGQHEHKDGDGLLQSVVGVNVAVSHGGSRGDSEIERSHVLLPTGGATGRVQTLSLQPSLRLADLRALREYGDGVPAARHVVREYQHNNRHLENLEGNSHALRGNHLLLHHLHEPAQLQHPENLHHARHLGVSQDFKHADGLRAIGIKGPQADDLDHLQPRHRSHKVDPEPALGVVFGNASEVGYQPSGDPVALVVGGEKVQNDVGDEENVDQVRERGQEDGQIALPEEADLQGYEHGQGEDEQHGAEIPTQAVHTFRVEVALVVTGSDLLALIWSLERLETFATAADVVHPSLVDKFPNILSAVVPLPADLYVPRVHGAHGVVSHLPGGITPGLPRRGDGVHGEATQGGIAPHAVQHAVRVRAAVTRGLLHVAGRAEVLQDAAGAHHAELHRGPYVALQRLEILS